MFKDTGPIFTFKDTVLAETGNYKKSRRNLFHEGEPCDEEGIDLIIEEYSGEVIDKRFLRVKIPEGIGLDAEIDRYLPGSAFNLRSDQGDGEVLTFYMQDPMVHIHGDPRQGKILAEAVYQETGTLWYVNIFELPRRSFQQMAVNIGLEKVERSELLEKMLREIDRDPVVRDLDQVSVEVRIAENALNATSYCEFARMERVVAFDEFSAQADTYRINSNNQQQVPYGSPVRFNDRLTTIDRDNGQLFITQAPLVPGFYKSFTFALPLTILSELIDQLRVPSNQAWKDFFNINKINGSVLVNT